MQLVVKYMCARINGVVSLSPLESLRKLDDVDDEYDDEFPFNKSLPPAETRRDLKKTSLSARFS